MDATTRSELIERYATAPARLRAVREEVPPAAMKWRPAPGKWSVHEVICHCGDSETNAAMRIRYLLGEVEPVIQGYDQDRWAAVLDYHGQDLDDAFTIIDATRALTLPLIRRQPSAAWLRAGRHTESGPYSATTWLQTYAAHIDQHVAQIRRNIAAWKARADT